MLAADYFEDFSDEHVSSMEFNVGLKAVRKSCSFFPKVKDFLVEIHAYRRSPKYQADVDKARGLLQIEDSSTEHNLTEEEIEHNKERVKAITDLMAGKISMTEALAVTEPKKKFKGRMVK